jgi:MOSC domain-containing protein YiiM
VHLIAEEVLRDLTADGRVAAGRLGENITTVGLDLMSLSVGTTLAIGANAIVALTGSRNPCQQIDGFSGGLLRQMFTDDEHSRRPRAGVMGVVIAGGQIAPGDVIEARFPAGRARPLTRV